MANELPEDLKKKIIEKVDIAARRAADDVTDQALLEYRVDRLERVIAELIVKNNLVQ